MTPDDKLPDDGVPPGADDGLDEFDEEFLAQIVALDESLEGGETDVPFAALSADERKRFRDVQDCLFLLAGARDRESNEELPPPPAETDEIPQARRFGRFELVRRLGAGGSGVVYLARDPQTYRLVALKVPLPDWFCRDDLVERFMREGEAAARLSHPNIVTIYEVSHFGPVCYMASEYCPGGSLAALLELQRRPCDPRAAAGLIVELAGAMHHAHLRGVLHRDLKPENVLLVPKRPNVDAGQASLSDYVAKIADFGLAKLGDDADDDTRSNAILGTVLYMSPEQARGSVREITAQTDVHALGAMLYELLTGEPPLRGSTKLKTLQLIATADPLSPRRLQPRIPSDLAAICLKCLEKEPPRRYASAAALSEDLQRFLAGEPTVARRLSPWAVSWRWMQQHPARTALVAVSLAALIVVFVSTTAYNARLEAALDYAYRESTQRKQLLYSADIRLAQDAWKANEFRQCMRILSKHVPRGGEPDLREFGWHYLYRQCDLELKTLRGHQGDVYCVQFAPDGETLFSCGKDRTIRAWEAASGKLLRTFRGHQGEVNTVAAVSAALVASASDDGTVRLWDADSGNEVRRLEGHDAIVFGMDVTSDGRWLVSGDQAGTIRLWDLKTGEQQWSREKLSPIESLSFSPRDEAIVSGHSDGSVCWWTRNGDLVHEGIGDKEGAPVTAAYSPVVSRVAVAGRLGTLGIHRHSAPGWREVASDELDRKAIGIHGLAFSPRDNTLAVGRRDGLVELWHAGASQLTPARVLSGHGSRVWNVAWSPDGRMLASAASDGSIKLWDGTRVRPWCRTYPSLTAGIRCEAVSPDGMVLLTGDEEGQLHLWNRSRRWIQHHVSVDDDAVVGVAVLPEGNAAITTGAYSGVHRWNLADGKLTHLAELPDLAYAQAISGDGATVAVGCEQSTAVVLDAASGSIKRQIRTGSLAVKRLALSHDGRLLATAGVGERIELWDTTSGQRLQEFAGHANRTLCLVFSPDDRMLASGGSDQDVRLWDIASGTLIDTLVGQSAAIEALAISPDGRNLVSGSSEPAFLQLWDLRTRQPLLSTGKALDTVNALAFTPDGRTVIAASATGKLTEWSLDKPDPLGESDEREPVALRPAMFGHPDSSSDAVLLETMQAAHRYARQAGFVTGYPTFHRDQDGTTGTMRVVLFNGENARTISMSLDEFCTAMASAEPNRYAPQMVPRVLQSHDPWFHSRGYKAALPAFFAETSENGEPRFEVTLLRSQSYKRREIPLDEIEALEDGEAVFRRVHSWAVENGRLSGFPTFIVEDDKLSCIVIDKDQATLRDVPIDELLVGRDP